MCLHLHLQCGRLLRLPACVPGPARPTRRMPTCPVQWPIQRFYCTLIPPRLSADIVILHDALDFGQCHLGLGVPMGGRFANINTLEELRAMPWSEQAPLRCARPVLLRAKPPSKLACLPACLPAPLSASLLPV